MLLLCLFLSPAPVATAASCQHAGEKKGLYYYFFLIDCSRMNKYRCCFMIVLIDCVHFVCIVIDQNFVSPSRACVLAVNAVACSTLTVSWAHKAAVVLFCE